MRTVSTTEAPVSEASSRIDELLRLWTLARGLLPARAAPCFGHMRLESAGRISDILLGEQTRTCPEVTLVDWRRAPLAEVFFSALEGEEYELSIGGRTVEGRLLQRHLLRSAAGELVEVESAANRYVRAEGGWREQAGGPRPRLVPRPEPERAHPSGPADVVLDAAQRRLVDLPLGRAACILGEAGCGKTTVALHRLARLRRAARARFRAAVIVPTDGLRRLTEMLLARLGAGGVEVWLYERWAARQARRAFPDLPRGESADVRAAILRLKRHPAIRPILSELAAQPPALPDEDERCVPSSARARRHDLQRLFGDRLLLERIAAAAGLGAAAVDETFEHTRVQFCPTSEEEWAHVDAERLATLDGRTLDDGTPAADAQTIDAEDYAVLFALERLRARRDGAAPASPERYDCVVLDEAQEFAPLELELIGRAVEPGGTLIVAGDAEQQVDPAACFLGWDATMAELGAADYESTSLEVSYRCPPAVTALAREVLDPAGAAPPDLGPEATLARFDSEGHLVAWLVDALRELQAADWYAAVAVILRTPEAARRLAPLVRRGLVARLALDGDFAFHAGINLTCVQEVKGLEFDHVIVADAGAATYPDTREARRALYVAATRPTRQLVVAAPELFTPILAAAAGRAALPPLSDTAPR